MTKPVLFVASLYNDGIRDHGLSYEYHNRYQPLARVVDTVKVFDFMQVAAEHGIARMNDALLDTVKRDRPEFMVVVPLRNEFLPEVMDEIKHHTTSVAYFLDDMWRLDYSQFWVGHFSFVVTSDVIGGRRFREAGHDNAIYARLRADAERTYDGTPICGHLQPDWPSATDGKGRIVSGPISRGRAFRQGRARIQCARCV